MDEAARFVLLIENNDAIIRLIKDQALSSLGYRVEVFASANEVIQQIASLAPDVILTDLNLPGFSAKDLMVALDTLGSTIPIIVIAHSDQESEILHAIRLGAADFLIYPLREAEVVTVVERTLNKRHLESEYVQLKKSLEESENLLQQRQADILEISSICQLLLSAKSVQNLPERICALALHLTGADNSWLSIYEEGQHSFRLHACQNLPADMQSKLQSPYEDELSALSVASGQTVSVHGENLQKYDAFDGFFAAMIVPFTPAVYEPSILVVTRVSPIQFTQHQQALLELVSSIASSAIQFERRYRQIENHLVMLEQANIFTTLESNLKYDLLRQASLELRTPLRYLLENVDFLLDSNDQDVVQNSSILLNNILDQAEILMDIADSMINYRQAESIRMESIDLNEIVRTTVSRIKPIAQLGKISINLDLNSGPLFIMAYSSQITRIFEGLLSNALKYSPQNSEVTIQTFLQESSIILTVHDQGNDIDAQTAEHIFDTKPGVFGYTPKRFGGIGISLPRIKEVISAYKGRIWIEPMQANGFTISFALPCQAGPAPSGEGKHD